MVNWMSTGKLEGNYLKNVEKDLIFDESAIIANYSLQKSNYFDTQVKVCLIKA